jgi:hypothetical protein
VAEVLGPPGYRENAVVRGSGPGPGHTQELIDICIGHDKQRPESYLLRHDLGLSGRCPGYHPPTVIQTVLPSFRDRWPRISIGV